MTQPLPAVQEERHRQECPCHKSEYSLPRGDCEENLGNVVPAHPRSKPMAFAKRTFWVGFTLFFMAVLFLGIFPPSTPRVFLNHRRAVEGIRELNRAEYNYAARHPEEGFACNLSDLAEQRSEPQSSVSLVDRVLASGTKSSYHFEIRCSQGGSQGATGYTITARPVELGTTGKYAFCTNQTGEIWYSENVLTTDCLTTHIPIERKYK